MNGAVTIRPKAKADLRRAHDWYEAQCPGLGGEFLAAHAEAFLRLEADPERFPVYYRGFRRVLTHRFPYKIFSASRGRILSSFASCTARKNTKANCAGNPVGGSLFSGPPGNGAALGVAVVHLRQSAFGCG